MQDQETLEGEWRVLDGKESERESESERERARERVVGWGGGRGVLASAYNAIFGVLVALGQVAGQGEEDGRLWEIQ